LHRGGHPRFLLADAGFGHVVELVVEVLAAEEAELDRAELQLLLVLRVEPGVEARGFGLDLFGGAGGGRAGVARGPVAGGKAQREGDGEREGVAERSGRHRRFPEAGSMPILLPARGSRPCGWSCGTALPCASAFAPEPPWPTTTAMTAATTSP